MKLPRTVLRHFWGLWTRRQGWSPPATIQARSTVGGTPVFGRRTDPVLRSAYSRRVTTMWENRPLQVIEPTQPFYPSGIDKWVVCLFTWCVLMWRHLVNAYEVRPTWSDCWHHLAALVANPLWAKHGGLRCPEWQCVCAFSLLPCVADCSML